MTSFARSVNGFSNAGAIAAAVANSHHTALQTLYLK